MKRKEIPEGRHCGIVKAGERIIIREDDMSTRSGICINARIMD